MRKWLSSFRQFLSSWQLSERETERPKAQFSAKQKRESDILPAAQVQPNETPLPSELQPVIVRGRAWYNTTEVQGSGSSDQQLAGSALGAKSLVDRLLHDSRTENRRSAAEALGKLGPMASEAILALLETIAHTDPGLRQAAHKALGEIDPHWYKHEAVQTVMPSWGKTLTGGDWKVNSELERHMCRIGSPAVSGLTQALSDTGDTAGKVYLLQVIDRMGPNAVSAVAEITKALGSQHPQTCIAAANALASIGDFPIPTLQSLAVGLAHWHSGVRSAMARCLARVGPAAEPAIPALLPLLMDREEEVRKAVVAALGQIGPVTVPWLIEIVQTRDLGRMLLWFKQLVSVSTWRTGTSTESIRDYDQAIRNLSWAVYEAIEERGILENVIVAALQLLGQCGPAASAALPAVVDACGDPNPHISAIAVTTLKQIRGDVEDGDRCGGEVMA